VSMESGKLGVDLTEQDATRLLAETVESFQLLATAREIGLVSEAPPGPLLASFDHDRLLQVLANLVGNALKFTEAGGCITLGLETTDHALRFTVRDDGCGIPPDRLGSVFERFSQASRNDRRGLGLGLYIARSIVEAHGGRIEVESEPGQGSTFRFTVARSAG
jgi:signal transduction histidine kinase